MHMLRTICCGPLALVPMGGHGRASALGCLTRTNTPAIPMLLRLYRCPMLVLDRRCQVAGSRTSKVQPLASGRHFQAPMGGLRCGEASPPSPPLCGTRGLGTMLPTTCGLGCGIMRRISVCETAYVSAVTNPLATPTSRDGKVAGSLTRTPASRSSGPNSAYRLAARGLPGHLRRGQLLIYILTGIHGLNNLYKQTILVII